ncbi:MAG: lipase family alpha/beta hydrolase [Bacteroidota bacterium]
MKLLEPERILKKLELSDSPQPEVVPLRYPLLLCHGYGALASVIKPSPMHEVCMLLRRHGVLAFAPNIVPYASIDTRATEWNRVLGKLCDSLEVEKMNVIAHSMSGLDMRYALQELECAPHVASLTTLASPHDGTSLAELVLKTPEKVRTLLGDAFNWFGNHVYPHSRSDAIGAVQQLTRDYVASTFNPAITDTKGVPFLSWSAATGKGTDEPLNPIYRYQNHHIYEQEGINDSFVSVASASRGEHLGTLPLSHLEQMGLSLSRERKRLYESVPSNFQLYHLIINHYISLKFFLP